jgi:hypothetical protein
MARGSGVGDVEFFIEKHSSVPIAQIEEQIKLAVAMDPRLLLVRMQPSPASLEAARIRTGVII